jgi:hypothetical protein
VGKVLKRVDRALHGLEEALMTVACTGNHGIHGFTNSNSGSMKSSATVGSPSLSQAPLE